jgi:RNA-directed DNA polymerase
VDTRFQDLCERLKRGAYRAPPVRRVEISKGPGKVGTRPLGIPTVEDRLLQRAVSRILEAVFEADFLECPYGFRPGRNPHDALRALRGIIVTKKVGHLFEADIRGYFSHIQHEMLQKMVAHRIADPSRSYIEFMASRGCLCKPLQYVQMHSYLTAKLPWPKNVCTRIVPIP